jgi:hypothetical protein
VVDPSTALRVTDFQRIIAFRNLLSHAYGRVDHRLVWALVEGKLAGKLLWWKTEEEALADPYRLACQIMTLGTWMTFYSRGPQSRSAARSGTKGARGR